MSDSYPAKLVEQYFQARLAAYISPAVLKNGPGNDLLLVDVRPSGPGRTWQIPGSRQIPAYDMHTRFSELPKDRLIVVYCWDVWCGLAATAALELLKHGYRVKELHGGVNAWQMMNFPQETVKPA